MGKTLVSSLNVHIMVIGMVLDTDITDDSERLLYSLQSQDPVSATASYDNKDGEYTDTK
jgi:hypothetical protein